MFDVIYITRTALSLGSFYVQSIPVFMKDFQIWISCSLVQFICDTSNIFLNLHISSLTSHRSHQWERKKPFYIRPMTLFCKHKNAINCWYQWQKRHRGRSHNLWSSVYFNFSNLVRGCPAGSGGEIWTNLANFFVWTNAGLSYISAPLNFLQDENFSI